MTCRQFAVLRMESWCGAASVGFLHCFDGSATEGVVLAARRGRCGQKKRVKHTVKRMFNVLHPVQNWKPQVEGEVTRIA